MAGPSIKSRSAGAEVSYLSALPPESPPTLSYIADDLWPGEVYQFVVAASNRCGLGEFSRVTDYVKMNCMAPDQPEKPVITNVDKRQVEVQWKNPRCNGSTILQYMVRWHQEVEGGAGFIEQTKELLTRSIAGTKYTLHDLEPGSPLQVWVSASNLVDNKLLTSPESLPTDRVFTLCDIPDTPEAPELFEPSAHTMLLVWVPPKCNGLPIDAYIIALYSEDTQFGVCIRQLYCEFVVSPDDLKCLGAGTTVSYLVRHLRGAIYYSATVSARNSLGASNASIACVPVQTNTPTIPDVIPDAPVVSDITPTSAVITWKLPAHDGGAALRGFHVEYSVRPNRSGAHQQEKVENGGEVTVSRGVELYATFLKPHRAYSFRVSPENRVGRASPSVWSADCVTPSLVEFTVTRYFAHRPPEEHEAARFVQRRYRTWRQDVNAQAHFNAALVEVLRHWHM
ncbi:hypothetical protein BBJ29_004316 [Phytophthora kernoviae]|uniref:Fibronectin type-III domain-containing protein n=1 Tax=Phytophthora kernoviae TaxID=325452 RepID=A0A3F2RSN1_9STRA|nr:hypothetical protein BBJ29_004316 [Phytophthora kernoviae]RLN63441.1 hypothetical protein BBP00_00004157 [Phytophthora kernoviae]